jgi:hypothetical protein
LSDNKVIPFKGAIIEKEVRGWYILVMTNMYQPLFYMTFYELGLDKFQINILKSMPIKRKCSSVL